VKKNFLPSGLLVLSSLLLAPDPASAASLILASEGGWNGFVLEADIRSGFRQAGGAPGVAKEIASTDSGILLVAPDIHPAGTTLTLLSGGAGTSPLAATIAPHTGSAKDIATGSLNVTFTIGTPLTDDAFAFVLASTTSAETAMVNFGSGLEPVDAYFEATIRLRSFAPAHIPGAVIQLPDMPDLTDPATESMFATFSTFVGGAPLGGFLLPGDSGIALPIELDGAEDLEYLLTYSVVTPFGSDPTFGYTLTGGSAVPEPSLLPLLGLGLLVRRRR